MNVASIRLNSLISDKKKSGTSSTKRYNTLPAGIHAILSLRPTFPTVGSNSPIDTVLFYWPVDGTMTDINRDNPSTLFLRVLHEICSTVCIPVTVKEINAFCAEKTTRNDTSSGIAMNFEHVTDEKMM